MTSILRVLLGAAGCALVVVGLVNLAVTDLSELVSIALWLGGGVAAHDAVFAPLVLVAGGVGARFLPPWARAPVAAGLVVLVTVTLMAVPVLGRFGAKPDDPWLLDRPYGALWLAFAGVVAVCVVLASTRSRHRLQQRRAGRTNR